MNLIILAAGLGSRFLGISDIPKPLIKFKHKPLFWWSACSAYSMGIFDEVFFIILKEHAKNFSLDEQIIKLFPNSKIIQINELTSGPAETARKSLEYIQNNKALAFCDCDLAFDFNEKFIRKEMFDNNDALLTLFKSKNPNFSYAKINAKNKIILTAEKKVISDFAIAGLYFFKNKYIYENLFNHYHNTNSFNELYLSGIYNTILDLKGNVGSVYLKNHISLGVPEELENAKNSKFILGWMQKV